MNGLKAAFPWFLGSISLGAVGLFFLLNVLTDGMTGGNERTYEERHPIRSIYGPACLALCPISFLLGIARWVSVREQRSAKETEGGTG